MKSYSKVLAFCIFSLFLVFTFTAQALADWPGNKPISVVISYKAGGGTDTMTRAYTSAMEEFIGTTINSMNRPGAVGALAMDFVASKPSDGYWWQGASNFNKSLRVMGHTKLSWRDWQYFKAANSTQSFAVRPDSPFKTMDDFIAAAKKNPGKLICGADGPLSDDQLAMVKMEKATGVKFTYVSYPGAAKAHAALLGKHSDFTVTNTFDVTRYKDKERCLVQFWKERYYMNPDTPTFKEVFGKEIIGSSTRAFAAPAKVPPDRLKVLREAFAKAANDPEYKARAKKIGLTLAWMDHNELGQFVKALNDDIQSLINELK